MAKATTKKAPEKAPVKTAPRYHAAYDKSEKARAMLAFDALRTVNLDPQIVATSVLAAAPSVIEYRDEIVHALPRFAIENVDNLPTYGEALMFAQARYAAASEPVAALPALQERGATMRGRLHDDAVALANRGFINAKRLEELKGGPGYLNTVADLGMLVQMFRDQWKEIAPNTGLKPGELDEAELLFERLSDAYAERQMKSKAVAVMAEERQRAYTLLINAYDEVQRAMTYLRWHQKDVEQIVPSLWSGRGGRGTSADPAPPVNAPGANTPAPPAIAPVHTAADPAAPPHEAALAGLPGGSPFTNN